MTVRTAHWIRLLVLMAAWVMARAQAPAAPAISEYRLPPGKLAQSEALYRTQMMLFVVGALSAPVVLTLLLVLRISARYRDWAERVSRRRFVQALVFAPLLVLTIDLLNLPLSLYGQSLQGSYGLSVQSWASWIRDWIQGELLTISGGILLAWGFSWILRRSPRRWWLWGWLMSIPLILVAVWGQPVLIDPLFNHFEPLEAKQPQLLPEIEKVMRRGGLTIERSRMFEMRASDKVTTYNAYVTGIGASKRVVVWDNTSKDLTIPETLYVFGHEQGHYVLHHIWLGIGLGSAGLLVAFYLAYRLAEGILARGAGRFGVRGIGDWASLPFFLLLANLMTLAAQPVGSAISRSMEHQADVYALEAIHGLMPDSGQVAAACEQKLGEKSLAYPAPHPLYVAWVYSHPPIGERLRFALQYQPWNSGQPLRYFP